MITDSLQKRELFNDEAVFVKMVRGRSIASHSKKRFRSRLLKIVVLFQRSPILDRQMAFTCACISVFFVVFRACIAISVCFILSAFAIASRAVYALVEDGKPGRVGKLPRQVPKSLFFFAFFLLDNTTSNSIFDHCAVDVFFVVRWLLNNREPFLQPVFVVTSSMLKLSNKSGFVEFSHASCPERPISNDDFYWTCWFYLLVGFTIA